MPEYSLQCPSCGFPLSTRGEGEGVACPACRSTSYSRMAADGRLTTQMTAFADRLEGQITELQSLMDKRSAATKRKTLENSLYNLRDEHNRVFQAEKRKLFAELKEKEEDAESEFDHDVGKLEEERMGCVAAGGTGAVFGALAYYGLTHMIPTAIAGWEAVLFILCVVGGVLGMGIGLRGRLEKELLRKYGDAKNERDAVLRRTATTRDEWEARDVEFKRRIGEMERELAGHGKK